MMWRLSLYILYAATLFSLVSANSPLNSCILKVQASKPRQVKDPRGTIELGILVRFSNSNPPVNPLTVEDGGTSRVFGTEDHDNGVYCIGFSVLSEKYENEQLKDIVTKQWLNTDLYKYNVANGGNWKVLSADC